MRKLLALVGAVSVVALGATASQAANVVNASFPVGFLAPAPCTPDFFVAVSGDLHVNVSFTGNANNASLQIHVNTQGLSGVGFPTGASYTANGNARFHFKGGLNSATVISFAARFQLITAGGGNNLTVDGSFHLTVNANGTPTAINFEPLLPGTCQ